MSEQMIEAALPEPTQAKPGLKMYLGRFLAGLNVASASKATYGRELSQFIAWLATTGRDWDLNRLSRQDVLDYRGYLQSRKLSAYTVSGYLTAVRKFFEYLEAEKIFPNVARGVKGGKKTKGFRKDCLTSSQIREALSGLQGGGEERAADSPLERLERLRDFALFNLLIRTGLRTVEVMRAKVGDIRQEGGEAVLWIQGKGRDSKDDFVLLTDEALKPLREYLQARGPATDQESLFEALSNRGHGALTTRSLSRIIKTALRRANLDNSRLTAHSLRHTAITLSLKGGASLQQVQAMARHTDPKTTMVYVHNIDRIKAGAERHISF